VRKTAEELVLAKPLEDGSLAVGLFNLTKSDRAITATWTDLALQGKRRMRDVWRQKDAGRADGELRQTVGAHGVAMIRLMK
ncbi:MAG: glycoside hydrolase family 27 protein, partial [Bryobacterales bacterium]|nr:glycoside hydrolase family 27 protein [Bryobacterales bacterium]